MFGMFLVYSFRAEFYQVVPRALSRETNGTANPRAFIPERFLDGQVTDPYSYAFGFGRRLCPGKAFAEGSLFILIASVLATFEITPALDETGQEIPINPSFASGLVRWAFIPGQADNGSYNSLC